jgi:hypothetical protein
MSQHGAGKTRRRKPLPLRCRARGSFLDPPIGDQCLRNPYSTDERQLPGPPGAPGPSSNVSDTKTASAWTPLRIRAFRALQSGRSREVEGVAGDRSAVVIEDDREPGAGGPGGSTTSRSSSVWSACQMAFDPSASRRVGTVHQMQGGVRKCTSEGD